MAFEMSAARATVVKPEEPFFNRLGSDRSRLVPPWGYGSQRNRAAVEKLQRDDGDVFLPSLLSCGKL